MSFRIVQLGLYGLLGLLVPPLVTEVRGLIEEGAWVENWEWTAVLELHWKNNFATGRLMH